MKKNISLAFFRWPGVSASCICLSVKESLHAAAPPACTRLVPT